MTRSGAAPPESVTLDTPPLDPEARTAGVIGFTDIVGFTEFTATQGDARALQLLDFHLRAVTAHLGPDDRVVKELGDGLLVWFADPGDAIGRVLAIQADLALIARQHEVPLWVRVGLHWGCPTPRGSDIVGHDVNLASRVSGQAGPGEVLITEPMLEKSGPVDGVDIAALGPIEMKGIPEPVWLYRASPAAMGS